MSDFHSTIGSVEDNGYGNDPAATQNFHAGLLGHETAPPSSTSMVHLQGTEVANMHNAYNQNGVVTTSADQHHLPYEHGAVDVSCVPVIEPGHSQMIGTSVVQNVDLFSHPADSHVQSASLGGTVPEPTPVDLMMNATLMPQAPLQSQHQQQQQQQQLNYHEGQPQQQQQQQQQQLNYHQGPSQQQQQQQLNYHPGQSQQQQQQQQLNYHQGQAQIHVSAPSDNIMVNLSHDRSILEHQPSQPNLSVFQQPDVQQQPAYHPAVQQASFHPNGQEPTYQLEVQQQPTYHSDAQQTVYHPEVQQQPNYHPEVQQTVYHPDVQQTVYHQDMQQTVFVQQPTYQQDVQQPTYQQDVQQTTYHQDVQQTTYPEGATLLIGQQQQDLNATNTHVQNASDAPVPAEHQQLMSEPPATATELSWHDFFLALQAHQNRTGSLDIEPNTNPPLEQWVATQRAMYHDTQRGIVTSLSDERKLLLDALGFDWEVHASDGAGDESMQESHTLQQQQQQPEQQSQDYHSQPHLYEVDIGTVEEFNERLQQLQSFKDIQGHCDIPQDYNNDETMPNIAKWAIDQRQFYHRGYLTQDRVDALLTMGFDFHIQDGSDFPFPTFEDRIRQLEEYKALHGDIKIPRDAGPEVHGLGEWLHAQKLSIQRMEMGEPTLMTADRCKLLLDLGIDLTIPADALVTLETAEHLTEEEKEHNRAIKWDEKYHELRIYKQQNGHTNVPRRSKRDPSKDGLGEWVHFQRRQHRNLLTGKNSTMSISRKKSLDYLGFQWTRNYETNQTTRSGMTYSTDIKVAVDELVQKMAKPETVEEWNERFAEFERYVQTHGNGNVPINYRENPFLSRWVQRQREMYLVWRQAVDHEVYHQLSEQNAMTQEKFEKLSKAGFEFTVQQQDVSMQDAPESLVASTVGEEEIPEEEDDIIEIFAGYEQSEQYPVEMESAHIEVTHHSVSHMNETGAIMEHSLEQQAPVMENARVVEEAPTKSVDLNESDVQAILNIKEAPQDQHIEQKYQQEMEQMDTLPTATVQAQTGDVMEMQMIEPNDVDHVKQETQHHQPHYDQSVADQQQHMQAMLSLRRLTVKVKVQWEERVLELVQFKLRKHHCNVPAKWKPNPGLADWVWRQRIHYRRYRQGQPSPLTSHRICLLSDLGFDFVVLDHHGRPIDEVQTKLYSTVDTEKSQTKKLPVKKGTKITPKSRFKEGRWLESLAKVVKYKEEHGNCNVPRKWKRDPTLGEWVHFQRRQFRLRQLNRRNHMTDERIHKLETIGFEWSRGTSNQSSYIRSIYEHKKELQHDQHDNATVDTSEAPADVSQVVVTDITHVVHDGTRNAPDEMMDSHPRTDQVHTHSFLEQQHQQYQNQDGHHQQIHYDGQTERGNEQQPHYDDGSHNIQYSHQYQTQPQLSHHHHPDHEMHYEDQQHVGDNDREAHI